MTGLTDAQIARAEEIISGARQPLPTDFERRVDAVMSATGRDRTWARARAAELWPGEHRAYLRARAA
ncbi:MAG: hypothetical protein ACRECX_12155 [Methyloceanibacter sp.]|uniref:hypothetical protein n=1 Tax=Methyloceanibacter sp. TaxID=1965321 RepID=UPI003D6CA110